MTGYQQARDLVVGTLAPRWREGTFHLDEDAVLENDELFVFRVGARELLVDGDLAYARFGGGVPAVLKASGRLVWIPEVRLVELAPSLRRRTRAS